VITSSPLGRTCVAPTSHEDLQVERMFPGHPDCPAKVVRGGLRVYLFIYSFIYLIGFHLHSFHYDLYYQANVLNGFLFSVSEFQI